jgi:ATP-binding cassette, subfamily B, bacterial HlyB/CyaB
MTFLRANEVTKWYGDLEVLRGVTFEVEPGQVKVIVGPSGSGKSTLAKLVQRLYVPESGRVLIDGVDLAMADVTWLRRQVGVVLQENVLFNRTIRENIALADPGLPIERVIEAATLAGAHDFILELPEGYDTQVGERGTTLSGGQRQRIAIARALVTNPRILIFDEATSALDYESERAVQQNMRRIAAGRTVLIIAHRLSTVRSADRILTLERGRLVEDGSHDELIRSNGRYASLHKLQAGLHEVG